MMKYYNARVKHQSFKLGDLVVKMVLQKIGALEPNWDGPYKIKKVVRTGTYQLTDLSGRQLAHPWNVEHLKMYQ